MCVIITDYYNVCNNDNYTFPVRRLGVHRDHSMSTSMSWHMACVILPNTTHGQYVTNANSKTICRAFANHLEHIS